MNSKIRRLYIKMSTCVYAILILLGLMSDKLNVSGEKPFGMKIHWGYLIHCNHIVFVANVTVTDCVKECLYRMNCQSVNYIVHHKYCEICANDDTIATGRRSGGVYIKRSEVEQGPITQECNCTANKTCRWNGNTTECVIEECGPPPLIGNRTRVFGNIRHLGSKIEYICEVPVTLFSYSHAHSVCQGIGEWTVPNITCDEPVFEGCFNDYPARVLNSTPGLINLAMIHEICETHCIEHYHRYFGVENGHACFCGNSLPASLPVDETSCDQNCPGDSSQNCGGVWFIAIYRIII